MAIAPQRFTRPQGLLTGRDHHQKLQYRPEVLRLQRFEVIAYLVFRNTIFLFGINPNRLFRHRAPGFWRIRRISWITIYNLIPTTESW